MSLGKTTRWSWWLIAGSLLYLFVEFIFNATLLNTASALRVDHDELHHVELFGRSVSGAGFSLLLLGALARSGFVLNSTMSRSISGLLVVVCLMPFFLDTTGEYRWWGALALLGVMITTVGVFRTTPSRRLIVIGTVLMAWTAMFAGQKIIIERFFIEPADWQTRLHAQYMHLLKSGLGQRVIEIEGVPFDTEQTSSPEERTFLALVGALVMDSPEFIQLAKRQEAQLVEKVSYALMDDVLPERYAQYQREGEAFQSVWQQYHDGSQAYRKARQTADKQARERYADVFNRLKEGYDDYLQGKERFRQQMKPKAEKLSPQLRRFYTRRKRCRTQECATQLDNTYNQRARRFLGKDIPWLFWCDKRQLTLDEAIQDSANAIIQAPFKLLGNLLGQSVKDGGIKRYGCSTKVPHLQNKLMLAYSDEFSQKTGGYGPTINSLDAFIKHPVSSSKVRQSMERQGVTLPTGWRVNDAATFTHTVATHIRQQAKQQWTQQVNDLAGGYIPPGYNYTRMVQHPIVQQHIQSAMGDAYVKGMTFELSEQAFKQRVVVPQTTRMIRDYLQQLREEGRAFANGEAREFEGKQFHRAVLIPPISLFLSLFFALVTAGKLCVAMLDKILRYTLTNLSHKAYTLMTVGLWGFVLVSIITIPYFIPNKFSASPAFRYFSDRTATSAPLLSLMAEWTIRMQPALYPVGNTVLSSMEHLPDWNNLLLQKTLSPEQRQLIDTYLMRGDRAYQQDKLLIPEPESAVTFYRKVLDIEPTHADALMGLKRITERYEYLAKKAALQGKREKSKLYLQRADEVKAHLSSY